MLLSFSSLFIIGDLLHNSEREQVAIPQIYVVTIHAKFPVATDKLVPIAKNTVWG